ncbi:MAG: hypothetical protein JSS79_10885 [Bacteroidetes bacterium]|nr:hypothetical protein [Bacteroidota bacterium]
MDNFMIGTIVLLISIFAARAISERAVKQLDQEKKVLLIDLFSDGKIFRSIILLLILVLFFVAIKFNLVHYSIAYSLFTALLFGYVFISGYTSYKKLKSNEFPDSYIQSFIIATTVRVVGIAIFFAIVWF